MDPALPEAPPEIPPEVPPALVPEVPVVPPAPIEDPENVERRRVHRLAVMTNLAVLMGVVLVTVAIWFVTVVTAREDLAKGKPWRASSQLLPCDPVHMLCGDVRTSIFFHTIMENDPWVEIDLGAPMAFSEVVVNNRHDGGKEVVDRAVPLVLEAGDDRVMWHQLGRVDESFSTWSPKFPPTTARYVRAHSPRMTYLHLEAIKVYK